MDGGIEDLKGKAGEAGAGPHIGDLRMRLPGLGPRTRPRSRGDGGGGEEMAGGEEGFAEVAAQDGVGITDGGEIDADIPAQEQVHICRHLSELGFVQGGGQKGLEELRDAGAVHGTVMIVAALRGRFRAFAERHCTIIRVRTGRFSGRGGGASFGSNRGCALRFVLGGRGVAGEAAEAGYGDQEGQAHPHEGSHSVQKGLVAGIAFEGLGGKRV